MAYPWQHFIGVTWAASDYTMRLEAAGIGMAHARLRREEELTEADIVTYLGAQPGHRAARQRADAGAAAARRGPPRYRPGSPGDLG